MRKNLLALIAVALFFAVASGGCGGGGSPVDTAYDAEPVAPVDPTSTNIIIEESGDYTVSYMALYGCNENLDWDLIWDSEGDLENDTTAFNVSTDYIMYGFEFDIDDDNSNWSYSGIFWADEGLSDDAVEASATQGTSPSQIRINLAGTESAPLLNVAVDGKTTTYNCGNNDARHDWNSKEDNDSGTISVHIETASAWEYKTMAFYARTNGGEWDTIKSITKNGSNNQDFTVSKKYVEFGFEVDVNWGTHWPYSGVFWTAKDTEEKGKPKNINIDLGGTSFNVSVQIKVDGNTVFEDRDCSRHAQYGWVDMRVEFSRGGSYRYKSAAFYGRKSPSDKWVKLIDLHNNEGSSTNHEDVQQITRRNENGIQLKTDQYIIPKDYSEFGFEFDITAGTNWPYSDVFWTASKNKENPARSIYIDTGGIAMAASIKIEVNGSKVVEESNLSSHAPHYFKQDDKIRVKTWKTSSYSNKSTALYGRKANSLVWTKIKDWTNGDQEFYISDNEGYAAYGFEFDITWGTNWPYSGVFWTEADSAKEAVEDIYIEMGGTVNMASIGIWVNGKKVIDRSNCDNHFQYYWRDSENIRVTIDDKGLFTSKSRNFYARKSGGAWELKYKKGDEDTFYLSPDYVEFGFEFDITAGTDWPYSGVFWTEAQSSRTKVGNIEIDVNGTVRSATISIYVNGNQVFHDDDCDSHSQYSW